MGPVDFQCPEGLVIYPHETQCELYYMCGSGCVPTYLWQCGDNLLFDLVYNGCNLNDMVDCGNRTRPFICPSPSGNFPISPDACSSNYYVCVNNAYTLKVRNKFGYKSFFFNLHIRFQRFVQTEPFSTHQQEPAVHQFPVRVS